MLILQSDILAPTHVAFSPDGQALLASGDNRVQAWPRWLDAPPKKPVPIPRDLERCAFAPDAKSVYVYMSGNSRTSVWPLARRKTQSTVIPEGGPAWFHFTAEGGYVISSHGDGNLARFDFDPSSKGSFRQSWLIERHNTTKPSRPTHLGSHYRFGAICDPAGVFVALEFKIGAYETADGIVVRSVNDGSVLYRKATKRAEADALLKYAGLRLSVHPSGRYFAYPQGADVRFYPLVNRAKVPRTLANVILPVEPPKGAKRAAPKGKRKRAPKLQPLAPECFGVAFHPSGELLAAVGNDGTVKLFDTTTWQVTRTFSWELGHLMSVCFSPDGTRAATIGVGFAPEDRDAVGGKVVVWDVDL